MKHIRAFLPRAKDLTPAGAQAVADVHELVAEWAADRLPLAEALHLCSPRQRNLAIRHTPPDDPRFAPLMGLLDAAVAAQAVPTRHGVFDRQDLAEAHAIVERADGRETIVFPVRYENGRAVYRSRAERGPQRRPFSAGPPPSAQEDDLWEV